MISYFFDDNGKFIKWSPLMNFDSIEALNASTKLGIPSNIKILNMDGNTNLYVKTNTDKDTDQDKKDEIKDAFKKEHTIDITKLVDDIIKESDYIKQIALYTTLIEDLESVASKTVYYDGQYYTVSTRGSNLDIVFYSYNGRNNSTAVNEVLQKVLQHESYVIPYTLKEKALQNANTAKINIIITLPENISSAHTPVDVDMAHKTTERRLGKTKHMTLWNPATAFEMQVENLTGKGVIGIAANGEKAFFSLYYYFTECYKRLKNNEKYGIHDPELERCIQFRKKFTRIQNRWNADNPDAKKSEPSLVTRNQIANLNSLYTDVTNFSKTEVDLMISQLLAAATDNAKELILAKINANADMAKIFFYCLTLGFDINDIVAFMTSPAVDLICELSKGNIFNPTMSFKTTHVLNMLLNGNFEFYRFISSRELSAVSRLIKEEFEGMNGLKDFCKAKIDGKLIDGKELPSLIDYVISKDRSKIYAGENEITFYKNKYSKWEWLSQLVDDVAEKVKRVKDLYVDMYGGEFATKYFNEDLNEFNSLWYDSNELTSLTNVYLSTNQGLPTTVDDYVNKLINIERSIKDREAIKVKIDDQTTISINDLSKNDDRIKLIIYKLNPQYTRSNLKAVLDKVLNRAWDLDIIQHFDYKKWLSDENYRLATLEYYDTIKSTFNIFHFLKIHPQYGANMKLFGATTLMLEESVLAFKIMFKSINELRGDSVYWDAKQNKNLLKAIGEVLTRKFLVNSNLELDAREWYGYNSLWEIDDVTPLNTIKFKNGFDFTNFKYVMDHYILPGLKDGTITVRTRNNNTTTPINNNLFIKHLKTLVSFNRPSISVDYDTSALEVSGTVMNWYAESSQGFRDLKDYIFPGLKIKDERGNETECTVLDLFVLYNLIVNQNRFGGNTYTSILKSMISKKATKSLLYKYYQYIGLMDHRASEYNINEIKDIIEDIKIKMSPIVTKWDLDHQKSTYVRVRDKGCIVLYKKQGKEYVEADSYVLDPEGNLATPTSKQNIAMMRDACLLLRNDALGSYLYGLKSNISKDVILTFQNLIASNKLIVLYQC